MVGEIKYEVVKQTIKLPFRTTKYYNIKQVNGTQIAYDTLMEDLFPRAKAKVQDEINKIESWKTQDIANKAKEMLNIVDKKTVEKITETISETELGEVTQK